MAATAIFSLLATAFALPSWTYSADIRVSVSTSTDTVVVGGILAIRCQVYNLEQHLTVNLFHEWNTHVDQISNGHEILRSSERLHMFLATRTFSDTSVVYFVTIVGVTDNDGGDYVCKVMDFTKYTYIAEDSISIDIYSHPAIMYPLCTSTPNEQVTLSENAVLQLKCTSEKGVPQVSMKWINAKSGIQISSRNTYEDFLIHSEANVQVDLSFDGALLYCEITSDSFPDWKRKCTVGPITIKTHFGDERDNIVNQQTAITNKGIQIPRDAENPRFIQNCEKCPSNDIMELYLTVATVGTGLLTIIFLATTILMCHKYHSISEQTRRQPARVLTSQQSVEPVYVSLQRRPQSTYSEREYMTLEDPNNPENKIILPKETFDDYCRTMSLKRV
ncbi:uncharacterized protein [Amphiura filiformis]|uniref:uncharacterized protein n=1 Tax=Amphiura filiformis TaxID=82378 RepID=UPI003B226519